jgi:hypothetical protein
MRVAIGGAAAMDGGEVADCKSSDYLLNRTDGTQGRTLGYELSAKRNKQAYRVERVLVPAQIATAPKAVCERLNTHTVIMSSATN